MAKFDQKVEDYVANLFGVSSKTTKVEDLPEGYDPLDEMAEDDNDFSLVKVFSKALDPQTGMPRDIKIPEGDFPEAKNYFDFCENFLGPDVRFPFTRQMWIAIHALGEYCPRCSHPRWANVLTTPLHSDPKNLPDRVQFLHYGKCPKCKVTKRELIEKKELNLYTEMALCIGQRAGKSTITASMSAYLLHKYLKYPKLSNVCEGIQASTPLTATFLGLRFADAYGLLWEPLVKNIKQSTWFVEFDSMLDDYGKRLGIEFYRHKDLYIKYMHKNLELYPSGPNKRALRGRTRWLSATDELGWWPLYPDDGKDRERADGEEVYKAIDRSLLTMRREMRTLFKKGYSNFVMPFNINVSSPADQADMITKLVEKNAESTRCLALRLPTWEVSPLFGRDNEEIVQAYKDDPVAAERDYGAMPPLNSSMWLMLKEAERPFIGKQHATVELVRALKDEEWKRYGKVLTQSVPQPCPATLMAIDAGYSNNSFAFVILALNKIKVGDVYDTKIECLCAGEIQPARGEKLHYTRIYLNVLKPLMRAFNTRYFFADRWNSIALLDRAADEFADVQLVAKQFSVKYVDFVTARSYVREGRLILPKIEMDVADVMKVDEYPQYFADKPAAHLLFQMLTVKDKGSSVVKGNNYTDDILRALVLGVSRILDPKIMEKMLQLSAVVTRGKIVGAVAVGRSAGMLNILGAKSGVQRATAMLGYSNNTPELSTGEQTQVAAKSHVVRINRSG